MCQLPQSPGVPPANVIEELERCVNEFGFIGCNLNPDPSGGHWTAPPLIDKYWYPVYEKMVELDVPAMVHVSSSCNPVFHATGAHYINADTTAFMQFIQGDLFKDFPTLRFIIPHGGGAVPFHWGRYRGLAQDMKRPTLEEHLLKNVFFDTCVYHLPGIELLLKVVPVDNILFGSEMVGAVRGIDPRTGQYYDDTKKYLDALPLSEDDRYKLFEGNARKVYPRIAKRACQISTATPIRKPAGPDIPGCAYTLQLESVSSCRLGECAAIAEVRASRNRHTRETATVGAVPPAPPREGKSTGTPPRRAHPAPIAGRRLRIRRRPPVFRCTADCARKRTDRSQRACGSFPDARPPRRATPSPQSTRAARYASDAQVGAASHRNAATIRNPPGTRNFATASA